MADAPNPMLDTIARRQEAVARLGARGALEFFMDNTMRGVGPSWAQQEADAVRDLTEKDMANWDRHWPAPEGSG